MTPEPENLKNRADAIRYLNSKGWHAFERDWAMGETIGVGAASTTHDAITSYERMTYICRRASGWTVISLTDPQSEFENEGEVLSLSEACIRVDSMLRSETQ